MDAIPFTDAPTDAHRRVLAALAAEPRAVIVVDQPAYVRAAVPTAVFHFVDDVEMLVDSAEHRIHFRASARVGHNDWGVNRRRMERIAARLRM
jgi:uncharacterized protein (DUF1499 family)